MLKRLVKSTVVAAVFGFVATLTVELVTMARVVWRFHAHTAIAVDYIHFTSPPFLISVLVFAATFAYCFWLFRHNRQLPIPVLAAVFGFVLVWTIAAAFMASISREPEPSPFPVLSIVVLFSSMIAIFGFYGGMLGGGWLGLRGAHIKSTARLLAESAVPGLVLGALFPVLIFNMPGGYTARSATPSTPLENIIPIVICAVAGCLISLAFALTFRRRLITPR